MTGDSVRTCLADDRAFATAILTHKQQLWPREILHSPTPMHQKHRRRWQEGVELTAKDFALYLQHLSTNSKQ